MVVGPQHQTHIFERDDDRQGPKEDGQNAVNVVGGEFDVARAKHFFDRIQDTGANVAVDHTDGTQSEGGQRRFLMLHEIRTKPGKVGIMRASGRLETLFDRLATLNIAPEAFNRKFPRPGRSTPARSSPPTWPNGRSRHTCKSGWARWHRLSGRAGGCGRFARRPRAQSSIPGR